MYVRGPTHLECARREALNQQAARPRPPRAGLGTGSGRGGAQISRSCYSCRGGVVGGVGEGKHAAQTTENVHLYKQDSSRRRKQRQLLLRVMKFDKAATTTTRDEQLCLRVRRVTVRVRAEQRYSRRHGPATAAQLHNKQPHTAAGKNNDALHQQVSVLRAPALRASSTRAPSLR